MTISALYPGETWHRRLRPVEHFLRYSLLMILIDLDEVEAISRKSHWFGYNRSRLLAFNDRDHGDGSATPLRVQVEAHLGAAGLPTGGAIRILCMPRVLGWVFNPLTVYYCHAPTAPDDPPMAVLYEVNNTFGQRHSYLLKAENGSGRTQARVTSTSTSRPSWTWRFTIAFASVSRPNQVTVRRWPWRSRSTTRMAGC